MKKRLIILSVIFVLLGGAAYYVSTFKLEKVQVGGCVLSSEDKVRQTVEEEAPLGNILLLWLKNKLSPIQDIPFVAKLDIEFVDKNTLAVTVYEKSVAGCIEYMDSYVYFDRDGIVLETTPEQKEGVPTIDGLDINVWKLNEALPVQDKDRFGMILNSRPTIPIHRHVPIAIDTDTVPVHIAQHVLSVSIALFRRLTEPTHSRS